MSLQLVPVTFREARAFIAQHHRHNDAPHYWKWGVGLQNGRGLVGVAVAGHPVGRFLNDGFTIEISRVCTLGDENANSRLYGAVLRAAKALGYRRAITYTLPSESGASLKAVGFTMETDEAGGPWSMPSRPRITENLFGETKYEPGPKCRWTKSLLPLPQSQLEATK